MYDNLLTWIVENNIDQYRKVHLLNPSDDTWTFGWNPLCTNNGMSLTSRVNSMVDAFVKVWEGTSITQTPRLKKCLESVLYALAYNNLSLAEARFLTKLQYRDLAKILTKELGNVEYEDVWREFLYEYSDKTTLEFFESTVSRLLGFLGDPLIREIVGQTDNLLNFRECMDERHIVLVNLARGKNLTDESSQLLGALLTTDMYNTAFGRDKDFAKRTPFYVTIDECADYITDAIAKTLDQTRKFGVHIALSHQRLEQLRKHGDDLYNAVMANAQVKVIFKVGEEETAEILSRHMFRREFDLELPKHVLDKPVVVGYDIIWLHSESETSAHITGEGIGIGSSSGASAAHSQVFDEFGNSIGGYVEASNAMDGTSSSASSFESVSKAWGEGRSESLMPRLELMPTATYSLEELVHFGMVEVLSLPQRHAFIYSPGQKPQRFSTVNIKPSAILKRGVVRATTAINDQSTYLLTRQHAQDAIRFRAKSLMERFNMSPEFAEDDDGLA
jgi:type IV secretory system conjugative DNA transfer VirD4/TraG family protein